MYSISERYEIFFMYNYIVDKEVQKHQPDKYDLEKLYDAGINALHKAIFSMEENCDFSVIDIKPYAILHIKSAINQFLKERIT